MAAALSMKLCLSPLRHAAGLLSRAPLKRGLSGLTGLIGAMALCQGAQAVDLSYSGFGTLGYAISDQPYHYQRYIDDRGTLQRDSVLGAQADIKFTPQWSATYQAMLAPSSGEDDDWSLKTTWAFVSWRPDNDWLLRVGKQRVPLFLNAENRDVGQTYDFARLPGEVYALSPTTDLIGAYVSRAWLPEIGETTLDMFAGEANMTARSHSRDLGPRYTPVKTRVQGLALTLRQESATWRLGLHHTATETRGDTLLPSHYPDLGGYYGVSALMGAQYTRRIVNDVISLGGDMELAPNWRLMAEVVRNIQMRTENGANTSSGYVALLHRMDRFTPYVSGSWLRSTDRALAVVRGLDGAVIPGFYPPADAAALQMGHRIAADVIQAYDQSSLAIGSSYALTPSSKLKLEWSRTRIGQRSAMVDSPSGGEPVRRQHIQVLSLNYSFAF